MKVVDIKAQQDASSPYLDVARRFLQSDLISCRKCKATLADADMFCSACGTPTLNMSDHALHRLINEMAFHNARRALSHHTKTLLWTFVPFCVLQSLGILLVING